MYTKKHIAFDGREYELNYVDNVLILFRKNLIEMSKNKDIKNIDYRDFKYSIEPITADIVIFIDDTGIHKNKILKTRY